jgi:small conductance mechanosensitive channel
VDGVDFLRDNAEVLTSVWQIVVIVVLALVLRSVLHRAITKVIEQAVTSSVPVTIRPLIGGGGEDSVLASAPLLTERRRQRTETIGSVLRSITSIAVFTVAGAMVLSELDFDLGPVIASAGIAGVALGFGAQNLVKDYLNGMFMILEDQYGVGDAIDAARPAASSRRSGCGPPGCGRSTAPSGTSATARSCASAT